MRLGRRAFIGLAGTSVASAAAVALGHGRPLDEDVPRVTGPLVTVTPFTGNAGAREDWDALIREAKREGTLSTVLWFQRGFRTVLSEFERAFPGIRVAQFPASSASTWLDRVRQERRAGRDPFDIAFVQPEAAIRQGLPEGMWTPLRPLLIRPEILDDAIWRGGLAERFLDIRGQFCFAWEYQVQHAYAVDSRVVKEGEIASARDLLLPKWTGKVITSDPRIGSGLNSAANVAQHHGNDTVRLLLVGQRPRLAAGGNALIDALIDGSYPIAQGVRPKALQPYRDKGQGAHIKFLDLPDADHVPGTALLAFNNTPHPAATRLFVNWVLTREGQTVMARSLATNSARTDVDAYEKDGVGQPGKPHYEPDRESNYAHTAATQQFVRGLLGA